MSYQAIHAVTKGLQQLLHSQLNTAVTLLPPGDELPAVQGVNLYLYRVIESSFTKNRSWPGDRATPASDQPALGLLLNYLLTPLGAKPDQSSLEGDDTHTMLGLAMLTLHEHSVLNDVHLPGFDADTQLPDFLLNSFEKIKVNLMPIGTEELSRIWATINKPYRLSVAYEVSLVQLTPTQPPPTGGGIVHTTHVDVSTLDPPRLSGLMPATGALARIVDGIVTSNEMRIDGFGLSFPGATPIVRVGGQPAPIKSMPEPTEKTLIVSLPTSPDAGPEADVRVTLNRRTSAPLVFTVRPWLSSIQPIRTPLDPEEPDTLTLRLSGSGLVSPKAVRFEGPGGTSSVTSFAASSDDRTTVTIPSTLENGVYAVRVVLGGGADSASNARTLEVIPLVSRPIELTTVSAGDRTVHRLTLNGARLKSNDVRLIVDRVVHQAGANNDASHFSYTLGRLLTAGTYEIAVNVEGHMSHTIALEV
jgi:hypothetical protein